MLLVWLFTLSMNSVSMFDFEQILIETGQICLLSKSMMLMLTIHFGMVKMATEFRLRI